MLILTRKPRQAIVIGDGIEIVVLGIEGDRVKLGVSAPAEVPVHRAEADGEQAGESAANGGAAGATG